MRLSHPLSSTATLAAGLANTLEAVVAAVLLRSLVPEQSQLARSVDGVFKFLFTCPVAVLLSASMGTGTLCVWGIVPRGACASVFYTWWLGDFSAMLTLTPAILSFYFCPLPAGKVAYRQIVLKWAELSLLLGSLFAECMAIFGGVLSTHKRGLPTIHGHAAHCLGSFQVRMVSCPTQYPWPIAAVNAIVLEEADKMVTGRQEAAGLLCGEAEVL